MQFFKISTKQKFSTSKIKSRKTSKVPAILLRLNQLRKKLRKILLNIFHTTSNHRKWIAWMLALLVPLYIGFYPKKLTVNNHMLGSKNPLSNPITFTNPNVYAVKNVKILVRVFADITTGNIQYVNNGMPQRFNLNEIPSDRSKSIENPLITIVDEKIKVITKAVISIKISYETPFIYPNTIKDEIKYKGVLNSDGEIIYLPI